MNRSDVVLVVASVLGSVLAFGLPLITMLWKAFQVIAELRLQISENRGNLNLLGNKIDHVDERWEAATSQTLQQFQHFSGRLKGDVEKLQAQTRDIQNYLSKETSFTIRSQ